MAAADGGWLRAGRVGRPHGLDGSFHVTQPTPALLGEGAALTIHGQERRIVRRAGTDTNVIIRLEGHEDRADVQALRGEDLLVARELAPQLDHDEWWADDLEGCRVHDAGREVGVVKRLLALPSCEVLEVARGEGHGDVLVPLISDAVREVDIARKRIEIDLKFLGED
jgi:16S rRNA processing protein RimM